MARLNLGIATLAMRTIWCVLLLAGSASGKNLTVQSGGGGNFATIQACATAMSPGDTCTVYAGTYNENVTVPAGTAGNYKIITVNGSDVVTVNSVTLGSHTQLVGNCTPPAAAGSCGFTFDHSSSPGGTCVSISSGATDVFVRANTLVACGSISTSVSNNTYYYIQGNTFAYAGCYSPNLSHTCGQWIRDWGDYSLVENNDFSHYQLGANIQGTHHIWRNNTFHDQLESEAGSNQHSDILYMEPNFTTGNIVLEGNFERNAVGPNAKQNLTQNDACSGSCTWGNVIERFNTVSRIGAAAITNDKSWPNIKVYNSTFVDEGMESSLTNGGDNMLSSGGGMAVLNSIWFSSLNFSNWNPYACSGCANYGHNLYWCTGTCTNVYGHQYGGGTFLGDPGNKNADPLFVSYVSAGSTSNNFHLQAGSPAIAAGTYLTTVASGDSGSGTSLVVSDATYFQDGYGLSNAYSTVNGDCIAVGTASNHVCVTTVNYTTNTLTLASSISRSAGQGVYLYSKSDGVQVLTGSAPNIGALGTAGSTPPVSITPSPVAFPNQTVGIQSSPLMVTVSNTGSATLTLNTPYFTVTGINAADFSNTGTGTCTNGGSVLAGNSCTALLIFTPSIEAAETATLNISGNANGSATINGTGIPTPPTALTDIVKP